MQNSTQQVFEELFQENENNSCFECGAASNQWASVNNGIFLCLNCSGLHRGFGVNVSFVRSVNMDSWSELQLAMMKNGGNARLRAFFDSFHIPKDGPVDFKYRTKAGAYYRDMLKALSEGRPLPTPPSETEGLELLSNKNPNFNSGDISGFGSTPAPEESAMDKVMSFMNNAVDKTVQVTKEAANKVSEPGFADGVKVGVVSFGTSVASGAKNLASKIGDKVSDPAFKEDVKGLGTKVATSTKEAAGAVADKSKEIWAHRDEYVQKGSEIAKQGFTSALGFFKKLTGGAQNAPEANTTSSSSASANTEDNKI